MGNSESEKERETARDRAETVSEGRRVKSGVAWCVVWCMYIKRERVACH